MKQKSIILLILIISIIISINLYNCSEITIANPSLNEFPIIMGNPDIGKFEVIEHFKMDFDSDDDNNDLNNKLKSYMVALMQRTNGDAIINFHLIINQNYVGYKVIISGDVIKLTN